MNNIEKTSKNNRFALLASLGEVVFHTKDLGNLWNITNKNTLYMTLSRYKSLGIIYRICNGLYSIKDPQKIDLYLIGTKFLHKHSYVSCESVLFENGIINQPSREITLVSNVSKRFIVLGQEFRSRQLKNKFLFNDFGIYFKNSVRYATVERAIADALYFNSKKYFDAFDSGLINWQKVKEISLELGYNIKIPKIYEDRSEIEKYIKELLAFIEKEVTEKVINEDLSSLLHLEKFTLIRKVLKREVLSLIKDEINSI